MDFSSNYKEIEIKIWYKHEEELREVKLASIENLG